MTAAATSVRALTVADAPAYKALRDHALAHHEEAFTSDAVAEAARTAHSYASAPSKATASSAQ
jgi:hypothetical protein